MIKIKSNEEIEKMREAGRITRETLLVLEKNVRPGVTTKELDKIAYDFIISQGGTPAFKNYEGFPFTLCTSINSVVTHGLPSDKVVLEEGDIISLDVGARYKGYCGDSARTYPVGKVNAETARLLKVTKECFYEGIKGLKAGAYVGDISNRIQTHAEKNGFTVVRELVGHGIGREVHEEPQVPNFGRSGSGPKLNAGAVIAIEPMINMGERNVIFLDDGWTCCTRDGLPSAIHENTVLITNDGVEILT